MNKENIIQNRSEIVFLYDIKDGNPNGDPLDENKPRIDEETEINIVTDVRLKRTIRDYLYDFKGYDGTKDKDIFVREIVYDKEKGYIQDGKMRASDFENNAENVITKCIDIRLFGGVIPLEEGSITFTGPVQFKMGRSLHSVQLKHIKGTGAFAAKKGAKQATFREEDILPYSLISFYGVINENAGKYTKLTKNDVDLLMDGIWNGTKNLISRSKSGQIPRLLLKINYKDENYHIGDIDKLLIKSKKALEDEKIRDISEIPIEISKLVDMLEKNKDKIKSIDYCIDERVKFTLNNEEKCLIDAIKENGILTNKLNLDY